MTFEEYAKHNLHASSYAEYNKAKAAWDAAWEEGYDEGWDDCEKHEKEVWRKGYVLVPVEPTEAMLSYGETGYLDPEPPTAKEHVRHIYRMVLLGAHEEE